MKKEKLSSETENVIPEAETEQDFAPEAEAVEAVEPEAEAVEAVEPEAEAVETAEPEDEATETAEPEAEAVETAEPEDEATETAEPEDEATDFSAEESIDAEMPAEDQMVDDVFAEERESDILPEEGEIQSVEELEPNSETDGEAENAEAENAEAENGEAENAEAETQVETVEESVAEGEVVPAEETQAVATQESETVQSEAEELQENPPKRKKRKTLKGFIIAFVAIILVAGIAVGGYFLGLLDFIFNPKTSAKKYFVLSEGKKEYNQIARIDAEVIDKDEENNLLLTKKEELRPDNVKVVTITLVDALTAQNIQQWLYNFSLDSVYVREPEYSLDAQDYPVVVVEEKQEQRGDFTGWETTYFYRSGLVRENTSEYAYNSTRVWSLLQSGNKRLEKVESLINGMIAVTKESVISYYDKNGKHLRDENRIFADSYTRAVTYDAEFNGILYAWNFSSTGVDSKVQLFGIDGICYAEYVFSAAAFDADVFVLNNGDVFIQEWRVTEDDDCDYKQGNVGIDVVSLIMNKTTGAITQKDLDFVVLGLQSAYNYNYSYKFPFALKGNVNNQAIIAYPTGDDSIPNGYENEEYVVLNDQMDILFTMGKEDSTPTYYGINADYYLKYFEQVGVDMMVICNAKGKVVHLLPANLEEITDSLIVTTTAIFNIKGEKLYSFATGKHTAGVEIEVWVEGNLVFMEKEDQVTGLYETYLFDEKQKDFVLVAVEDKFDIVDGSENYYVICDRDLNVYSLYNANREVIMKTQNDMDLTEMKDVLYVKTEIDGAPVTYVVSAGK